MAVLRVLAYNAYVRVLKHVALLLRLVWQVQAGPDEEHLNVKPEIKPDESPEFATEGADAIARERPAINPLPEAPPPPKRGKRRTKGSTGRKRQPSKKQQRGRCGKKTVSGAGWMVCIRR